MMFTITKMMVSKTDVFTVITAVMIQPLMIISCRSSIIDKTINNNTIFIIFYMSLPIIILFIIIYDPYHHH